MPATQRFVMMVDPAERAEWRERAAKAGMTTAELVRRAVSEYEPEDEMYREEFERLLPQVNAAIDHMHERFDHMAATLDYALDPQRDVEARERARAALTVNDVDAMHRLLA